VCYLQKHVSCLQGYLYHWSDHISCLEDTKCCISSWNTPAADRGTCAIGGFLFQVWKAQNDVYCLEQHINCCQGYLYVWSTVISYLEGTGSCASPSATHQLLTGVCVPLDCLVSCLDSTQCFALPWVTHQMLTGLFVLLEYCYFLFRRHRKLCITISNTPIAGRCVCAIRVPCFMFREHTVLCITFSNTPIADRHVCAIRVPCFMFREHTVLCITFSNTPIADRGVCTVRPGLFCVSRVQNSVHYL
jgi:hypothetical protein